GITSDAIEQLIAQRVATIMTSYEANRDNDNGSQNETSKGTKGAVGLARWFEKIEYVFYINNFTTNCQVNHTQRFQKLALLFPRRVLDEEKKIEGYIWGHPDSIQGNSKQGNNCVQQTPPKRQNVARAYTAKPREKNMYAGTLPFCNKYKLHRTGSCTVKCGNYKRVGHMTRDCRTHVPGTTQGAPVVNQKVAVTCYECGKQGYYRRRGEANQEPNVVAGMFLLNNHYASILFDTGADRSFVSTTFSPLIDIVPTALDTKYTIELADGKLIGTNSIIQGCTLNFLNHPFNIDLMLVELGSFDVIIGMEWLMKYHAVIICYEKIVHILFCNEILTIQGEAT
ncbi:putative reverse transcriptase domain-containing protein, partial [Tanacetum coccineum]